MSKGRITIPTDEGFVEETKRIMREWGADAVRDCDGTVLPSNAAEFADKVYNTYFVVRGDNEWGRSHPQETHRTFLMSDRAVATEERLAIDPMKGYFAQQIAPDWTETSRWQVFDRTTGEEVFGWKADEKQGVVVIPSAKKFHEYTVDFLAKVIWHPVQIYNYLTNNWTCEKQLMYDPAYPQTAEYIGRHMREWCEAHPETNVVRFTTFLYQFSLIFNEEGKEKYVDWFGYTLAASPAMLDRFEKEYGYRLTAEDLIDKGFYNNPFRLPTKKFRDFMDFVCRFVSRTIRPLVDICHEYGKEAMMFLGDDWIGSEPYGEYFKDMNLDAVVGSVGGGVTVRMLSEIPHVKYREGRMLPYFFPDTFHEGNEEGSVEELNRNWMTARRAMLRNPLDRIGFGGYLSLADRFPAFMKRAAEICEEFRVLYDNVKGGSPQNFVTVGILNAWGEKRSWMCYMVAHELWYQQIYSYQGILEALSGLPVDVRFLSFEDIRNGVPAGIDVIVNAGDAGTAWSGGEYWLDEQIVTAVREFVYRGGGIVGIGEPTAVEANGKFFQLSDVFGVEKERGLTLSADKYNIAKRENEFITADLSGAPDYGEGMKNVYALEGAQVLDIVCSDRFRRNVNVGEVKMAANTYGKGRAFYAAGLPYSFENARLLYRALLYVAGKEGELHRAFSTNVRTDCGYYAEKDAYAVINNSKEAQVTDVYDMNGKKKTLKMQGGQIVWLAGKDF